MEKISIQAQVPQPEPQVERQPETQLPPIPQKKDVPAVNDIFKTKINQTFIQESRISFHRGPHSSRRNYRLIAWSFAALFIDWMVCLSGVLFLSLGALLGSRFLEMPISGEAVKSVILFCAAGAYVVYHLILRVFVGSTIGEWACGIQVGEPHQRLSLSFGWAVQYRFLIILMTGVFPLPLLSALTGQDWAGKLSGLSLVHQVPSL